MHEMNWFINPRRMNANVYIYRTIYLFNFTFFPFFFLLLIYILSSNKSENISRIFFTENYCIPNELGSFQYLWFIGSKVERNPTLQRWEIYRLKYQTICAWKHDLRFKPSSAGIAVSIIYYVLWAYITEPRKIQYFVSKNYFTND